MLASDDNTQKKSKLIRNGAVDQHDHQEENEEKHAKDDTTPTKLPEGTPEWGVMLLEIMKSEFCSVSNHMKEVELDAKNNRCDVKRLEQKLQKVEKDNKLLVEENTVLKERLSDIEYQQKRCNLIFDGVLDTYGESDIDCIRKVRRVLSAIPDFDAQGFVVDRCYRLDGKFKINSCRCILCTFNWSHDVQKVLRGRKHLPKGIYVAEDFPEEWVNRRKILKPLFMVAKKSNALKDKMHLSKDRLVIDGKTYVVSPSPNYLDANKIIDMPGTCQRTDDQKIIFLGCHSVFSNLHSSHFVIDNISYNCVEQRIQSEKAGLFNDDITQAKIMRELNPYKIKKLGSKVRNYSAEQWNKAKRQIAYSAVHAKFSQNESLKKILLNTGSVKIAESSMDKFWGTGLHLYDKNAMDQRFWVEGGGFMCELYSKLRNELGEK